jgi:hypothetical protein
MPGSEKRLRLFVVGEESGIPREWTCWYRSLVVARDASEAASIAGTGENVPIAEVVFDEPMLLFHEEDIGNEE